jgi:hypothetical protein
MSDFHDHNGQIVVVDLIKDAVVVDADSVSILMLVREL